MRFIHFRGIAFDKISNAFNGADIMVDLISNFSQISSGFELALTITLVLQTNRITEV